MAIIQPDIVLYTALKAVFGYVRADLLISQNQQDSYLYQIFGGDMFNNLPAKVDTQTWFQKAQILFSRDEKTPLEAGITFGFKPSRSTPPHIHLVLQGDNSELHSLGLGAGIGKIPVGNSAFELGNIFYKCTYDIIVLTNNADEAMIICSLIKAGLFSLGKQLELSGIQNLTFGSSDMVLQDGLDPHNLYTRRVTLTFDSELIIPLIPAQRMIEHLYLVLTGFGTPDQDIKLNPPEKTQVF